MHLQAPKPRIIIESHIPHISGILEPHAHVLYLKPEEITQQACLQADALIIRTRTHCTPELLDNTPIQLIATATSGTDHIDLDYCQTEGITVSSAAGSNAWAVVQWTISALMQIDRHAENSITQSTVGIVGAGNVGARLADTLSIYGVRVLLYDPPLQEQGVPHLNTLEEIKNECDIITLHVPHTTQTNHPTHHLIHRDLLNRLRKKPYIINASRGGVIDDYQLLDALQRKKIRGYCLDVYEEEPLPPIPLLEAALIATPHIAGYSIEGKKNATAAAIRAVQHHFDLPEITLKADETEEKPPFLGAHSLHELAKTYDILRDSRTLKAQPHNLEPLRNQYAYRHDYQAYDIGNAKLSQLLQQDSQ